MPTIVYVYGGPCVQVSVQSSLSTPMETYSYTVGYLCFEQALATDSIMEATWICSDNIG